MSATAEPLSELPPLQLRRNEHRRLRAGHVWVYSNEVDTKATPLRDFQPGDPVALLASDGKYLGNGYVNPHSLICARLVSRHREYVLNHSLLVHRIQVALSMRERLFDEPYYRLVFGESDRLPGLVVDRYGDVLVVQIATAGMERVREDILTALDKVLHPRAILLRNDVPARSLEGLDSYVETGLGDVPESVEIMENGVRFSVPLLGGQKTGWFFDQRANRGRLRPYVRDRRVLDVFSYTGSWGVQAACFDAREVLCVESSAAAAQIVSHNAALNDVADRVSTAQADAFDVLKALRSDGERFDVVILDPPAFIKRKKDAKAGLEAYQRLNQLGMRLLGRDGMLITSSCSYHLARGDFLNTLRVAALKGERELQLLEQGHQAPDHPVVPAIPETEYLKNLFLRVLPR